MTPTQFYEQAPKELVSLCNLCGAGMTMPPETADRYGLPVGVGTCVRCGLSWLSPRMTPAAYAEFYRDGHYRRLLSEFYGREINHLTIEPEQAEYAARLSAFLAPHMAPLRSGLLLDVGGSTGVVAERLQLDYDLDATVIEPSAAEAERARGRGLAVAQLTAAEYANGGNRYDLITLCQTVDHLLDIKGDLKRIAGWLKPEGLFFVDFVENGPIKIDHPYYLTRVTMAEYLKRTGFTVILMDPAPDGLHVNVLAGLA